MSERIALEGTLLAAIGLMAIHLAAPALPRRLEKHRDRVGAIGGGLAVSYVFLHLLVELDDGHELIGERIHFVVLAGFLLFFGIEHVCASSERPTGEDSDTMFWLLIGMKWIYSWLFIYALPESIQSQGWYVAPIALAIALHVLHDDLELCERFGRRYEKRGCFVLATAPLVGWVTDLFFFDDDPLVSNLMTALLAGSVLYTTLGGTLIPRRAGFWWFLLGVVLLFALHLLSDMGNG